MKHITLPLLLLLSCVLMLSACAPDPRKEADAYRIRAEANAASTQAAIQSAADAQANAIQAQSNELDLENKRAAQSETQSAMKTVIHYGGMMLAVTVVLVLLGVGIGSLIGSVGTGRAVARAGMLRASLIRLDPATRQFPAFLQDLQSGRRSLTDPNTGSTLMLDEANQPDRLQIATAGRVRLAGVIGDAARRSSEPSGVAQMQPPGMESALPDEELALKFLEMQNEEVQDE